MRYYFTKISILLTVLFMAISFNCHAQESTKVSDAVNKLTEKYNDVEGVDCMTVVKGGGLEMLKLLLNKEFGKSFMKGVTSITIIDYSDASIETCNSIRKDLDVFMSFLEEFDLKDEENFSDNDYIRCFASSAVETEKSATISDFVVALESENSKTMMYMAGKIVVE